MPDTSHIDESKLRTLNYEGIGGTKERANEFYLAIIEPFYREKAKEMNRFFGSNPRKFWTIPFGLEYFKTSSEQFITMPLDNVGFTLLSKDSKIELSKYGNDITTPNTFSILAAYSDNPLDDCVFSGTYTHFSSTNRSEIIQNDISIQEHRRFPMPFDKNKGLEIISKELCLELAVETYLTTYSEYLKE